MSQQAFYPSNHRSPDLGGHIRPRSRNQSFRNANTTGSVFFNNTTTNATTSNATSSIFTNSSHLGQTGLRGELSIKKRSSRSPGMKVSSLDLILADFWHNFTIFWVFGVLSFLVKTEKKSGFDQS